MYQKLPGESFDFDFEDIAQVLKRFTHKIKEFHRDTGRSKTKIYAEMKSLNEHLEEIFGRPRGNLTERARLETLEGHYKAILIKFNKIKPGVELDESLNTPLKQRDDEDFHGIVECEHLAVQDTGELRAKKLNERKQNLEQLHQEMTIVSDMFKDTAKMVVEQGEILDEAEENVFVAVSQTKKAVEEMVQAEDQQKKAKNKIWIIFIVAFVLVGTLLAIVLGVIYTR